MPLTCITHPECSHNTNGRDINKPCSIAYPTPTSGGWTEAKKNLLQLFCFLTNKDGDSIEYRSLGDLLDSAYLAGLDTRASEITKAVEAERERVREWAETFYLDVEVVKCECGEKWKETDLSLRVSELKAILSPQDK